MIQKYVLAGAPCAGKTEGVAFLKEYLTSIGYRVFVVSETGTKLIKAGLDRKDPKFPYYNFALMTYKELKFEREAREHPEKDSVILCDRGRMDPKAYRGESVFRKLLTEFNIKDEETVMKSYDAVLYLVTAAIGAEQNYKTDEIRSESIQEARELDKKLSQVWGKHEKFIRIDNCTDFNKKIERLKFEVENLLNKEKQKCIYKSKINSKEIVEYVDKMRISNEELLGIVTSVLKSVDKNLVSEHDLF